MHTKLTLTQISFPNQFTLQPGESSERREGLRSEQTAEAGGSLKPWAPAWLSWPQWELFIKWEWLTKMSNKVPKSISESRFPRYILSPYQSKTWTFTALFFLQPMPCFPCKGNSRCALKERWNQVVFRRELQCISVWCLIQMLGRLGCRAHHGVVLHFSINKAEAYHRTCCILA